MRHWKSNWIPEKVNISSDEIALTRYTQHTHRQIETHLCKSDDIRLGTNYIRCVYLFSNACYILYSIPSMRTPIKLGQIGIFERSEIFGNPAWLISMRMLWNAALHSPIDLFPLCESITGNEIIDLISQENDIYAENVQRITVDTDWADGLISR